MNSKIQPRKSITIPNSRWTAYVMAGAATSLGGLASAEAAIHYSGPINFRFQGTLSKGFPLTVGAALAFEHIDEGFGKGFAHLIIPNAPGTQSIGAFAADGGREDSASGFYLSRIPAHLQVSQLRMEKSCRTTSSSNLRCYGATIGLGTLPGCHFIEPGRGFIAFTFNTGAGNQYGWARVKTTGAPLYNFILIDYAWADPGEPIGTGQTRSQGTAQAVSKPGSLGLLATGARGVKAWRQQKTRVTPN